MCATGVASTIVDLTGDVPRLRREGAVTADQVSEVIGTPVSLLSVNPAHVGM